MLFFCRPRHFVNHPEIQAWIIAEVLVRSCCFIIFFLLRPSPEISLGEANADVLLGRATVQTAELLTRTTGMHKNHFIFLCVIILGEAAIDVKRLACALSSQNAIE